jgi:hypothetical protein
VSHGGELMIAFVGQAITVAGTGQRVLRRLSYSPGVDAARRGCDRAVDFVRLIGNVALRSRRSTPADDCSPSKPIVPSRPSSLPSSSATVVVAVC